MFCTSLQITQLIFIITVSCLYYSYRPDFAHLSSFSLAARPRLRPSPPSCKTHSIDFALPTLFRASTFKRTQDQKPIPTCTSDGAAAHGPCALTFPLNSTSTQLNAALNIDHKQAGGFHPAKVHRTASGLPSVLARVGRHCRRRRW